LLASDNAFLQSGKHDKPVRRVKPEKNHAVAIQQAGAVEF
jgi:hypothetical protein